MCIYVLDAELCLSGGVRPNNLDYSRDAQMRTTSSPTVAEDVLF